MVIIGISHFGAGRNYLLVEHQYCASAQSGAAQLGFARADIACRSILTNTENKSGKDRFFEHPFPALAAPRTRQNTSLAACKSVFKGG